MIFSYLGDEKYKNSKQQFARHYFEFGNNSNLGSWILYSHTCSLQGQQDPHPGCFVFLIANEVKWRFNIRIYTAIHSQMPN